MKRISLLSILVALLFAGCRNDFPTDDTVVMEGETILTLSLPDTRTSLGEKAGDIYPVYWSEGDRIVVNGRRSDAVNIDKENRSRATFTINATLSYPYRITYPYNSSTTISVPRVTIPSEQRYCEDSFAEGCAPMCGYVATEGDTVELKHLVAVLRFPIRAQEEGTVLQKVVIKSRDGVKLSGDYTVDCQSATLTPVDKASSSVTYLLPSDFTLSTTQDKLLYISLPAGETGGCVVEFCDSKGGVMVGSWPSKMLRAGVVREFKTITYKAGASCSLPAMGEDEDVIEVPYPVILGNVRDTSGRGIANVAVSNGYTVTTTDENGKYVLPVTSDVWYIYITLPAEYEVPLNEYGQPCFYQRYSPTKGVYDFTLTPLAGGKEKKFALVVLTDIHLSSEYRLARFENEAVPSIASHIASLESSGLTCYGLTLGDIINNSSRTDTSQHRPAIRALLAEEKMGMPIFQIMGNHDSTFCSADNPIYADETSSTYDLKMQRAHEEFFGPVNYSFNRGDVHIIAMRNIIYRANNGNSTYEVGFTDEQLSWLKQDLALVPKNKMVVLGAHIKIQSNYAKNNIREVAELLGAYREAHVFTGHSHIQRHYPVTSDRPVFEHNLCAVCGASWYCKMCEDGTPIGYNVFVGEGATFSDWYHMAFNKKVDSRAIQMRLYRGDAVTGAEMPSAPGTGDNTSGVKGYYKFNFAENVLLANVYNADSQWTVKVYEDGVYSGTMTLLPSTNYSMSTLVGDGSWGSPFRFDAGVESGQDLYTAGLLMGIQGRFKNGEPSANCWSNNYHMFKYELKNKDAAIKVVAIDRFGNEYTETKITEGTDYTLTSGDYKTDVNL